MATNGGHVNVASDSHEEHDHQEYRKRVATYVDGDTASYEQEDITPGLPVVLDVFTDLGRAGHSGFVSNIGPGDLLVEFSKDSATYGGQHTLRGGDTLTLDNLNFRKIRLTAVDPTDYTTMVG